MELRYRMMNEVVQLTVPSSSQGQRTYPTPEGIRQISKMLLLRLVRDVLNVLRH